jgi:hypothetical protein
VVLLAEAAFRATRGDLSLRLLAAMTAAREAGGDGRCSCSVADPDACGAPPPGFTKSAHTAFAIVSRMGDLDGTCDAALGCTNGSYYFKEEFNGSETDPDPVLVLQDLYADWRANLAGRPDGILSHASSNVQRLVADGRAQSTITLKLVDIEGVPLSSGGATVLVSPAPGSSSDALAGPVIDHGDGSYSFEVTAGNQSGEAQFVLSADDGAVKATLYPYLGVPIDALVPLHCGFDVVTASVGTRVPLTLNLPEAADQPYLILASVSGTRPGTPFLDVVIPLNMDEVMVRTFVNAGGGRLPGTQGRTDASGHADAALVAPPGLLGQAIGLRMDWAAVYFDGATRVTNNASFAVVH